MKEGENETAVQWAREQHIGGPPEYAVLLAIAFEADDTGTCSLSIREIARKVGTDKVNASRILDRLKGRGLVTWIPGAGRAPNTYQLTVPVVGVSRTHYTTRSRP